jgi:hypothetical protein
MTHTGPMPESSGELADTGTVNRFCDTCATGTMHREQKWESSDGAYEDYKYTCTICGHIHWVDGIDS